MKKNIIAEKSKNFAIRIIRLSTYLQNQKREYILSKQILRCGTSIGANVRESKNAQSKPDFISKLSIALKEADETAYWLELLYETDIITEPQFRSMYRDVNELIYILTAIIKQTKNDM